MDPISLFFAAQAAVSAIKQGCQMLSEGRAELSAFKKTVEGTVSDAKALYEDVRGLWSWVCSLFKGKKQSTKSSVAVAVAKVEAAKPSQNKAGPAKQLTYEEFQSQAIHQIFEQLKVYFPISRQLEEHCKQLEEESKTTDKIEENAIDIIEMRWQLKQMRDQVKHAMIYGTPQELGLGDMYSNFLKTYDEI